ncbi:hypothetical protein BLA29_001949, partial [Euroglyphus maynei]
MEGNLNFVFLVDDNGHDEELYENLVKCDAIMVAIGQENEVLYCKSTAIQTWLFGYEMTDVIMVFCKHNILILASKKKIDFLKTIESGKENEESVPPVTLLVRDKTDKDGANFDKLLMAIENSGGGKCLGSFIKDKFPGEFTVEWQKRLDGKKFQIIDISIPIAYIMATKDDQEINLMTKSAMLTCELYTKYLKEELTRIIDEDRKVRHIKLTEGVEQASQNKKYIKNVDTTQVELCYPAIIQSGGQYNLKFSATSDKNNLHFGTITCSVGLRYRQYCSNIVRTLLVNPTEEQKKHYEFLLSIQDAILERLRPGAILSDIYQMAADMVTKYDRKLVEKFTRNCGFIMGIEFRESSLQIAPKSTAIVKRGMIFNVSLGLSNLENREAQDEQSKIYALFIGDTVLVKDDKQPAQILTQSKKKLKNIAIIIRDDDEDEEEEQEQDDKMDDVVKDALQSRGRRTAVIDTKLR